MTSASQPPFDPYESSEPISSSIARFESQWLQLNTMARSSTDAYRNPVHNVGKLHVRLGDHIFNPAGHDERFFHPTTTLTNHLTLRMSSHIPGSSGIIRYKVGDVYITHRFKGPDAIYFPLQRPRVEIMTMGTSLQLVQEDVPLQQGKKKEVLDEANDKL